MDFVVRKADLNAAVQIVNWDYPAPYQAYSLSGSALALARFVDGPYFSVFSDQQLIGFFCYGVAAQLNGRRDHELYQTRGYLDIGLGMHPAWCGKGKGLDFLRAGLGFARRRDWQEGFRLTVASNNARAYKVYSRLGFREIGRIPWNSKLTCDFVVMTLDSFEPDPQAGLAD